MNPESTSKNPGPAVLLTLLFGPFLSMLDSGIVNVGLPSMADEFHAPLGNVQWVASVYLLGISVLLPFLGTLADRVGRKRIYTLGYFVLAAFTLACGFAPDLTTLVLFRVFQSVGAAMIIANGMALVTENYPPTSRGRNLGILATVGALGSILGPALGGLIIGAWGWRAVFPVTFAVAFVGAVSAAFVLPHDSKDLDQHPHRGVKAVFKSLLGVDLFRLPRFRSSWILSLVGFLGLLTPTVLIPFYFQSVAGLSPQLSGLAMMSFPVVMALVAPWAGKLSDRWGSPILATAGLGLGAGGLFGFALVGAETPSFVVMGLYGLLGLAMGTFQSPNNSALMGAAPRHLLGSATAFTQLARNLGTALAIAGAGGLFTLFHGSAPAIDTAAFFQSTSLIFLMAGTLVSAAAVYSYVRSRGASHG